MAALTTLGLMGTARGRRAVLDITGPILLERRTLYPSLGDWEVVGYAEAGASQASNDPFHPHAASQAYEYRIVRQGNDGTRSDFPTAPVRLDLDSGKLRVPGLPARPLQVTAKRLAGGKYRLSWLYDGVGQDGSPVKFRVYAGSTIAGISFAAALTDSVTGLDYALARPSRRRYTFMTAAFGDGTEHAFAVRAEETGGSREANTYGELEAPAVAVDLSPVELVDLTQ